jgi:Fe2+ transport system protein FeoA
MSLFISNTPRNSRKVTGESVIHPNLTKNLDALDPGEEGFVFSMNLDGTTIKELEQVGVKRNSLVESICRNDSAIIIQVDDRRVAVDRDTASNILVHPV